MNQDVINPIIPLAAVEYKSYEPIVQDAGISYRIEENWIRYGSPNRSDTWVLYISVVPQDAFVMLSVVLPLLKRTGTPFVLIRDQKWHYRLNGGAYPLQAVGKVIAIYPNSISDAIMLAGEIEKNTQSLRGQFIADAVRIGEVLYTKYFPKADQPQNALTQAMVDKIIYPDYKSIPFVVDAKYKHHKRSKWLGGHYIPVKVIKPGYKGAIFKGVNLKNWSLSWCLIKQGIPYSVKDPYGRDISDRLFWQKSILDKIANLSISTKALDCFIDDGHTYLVTEFLGGQSILSWTAQYYKGINRWLDLPLKSKQLLLWRYIEILDAVSRLHSRNIVHRDITPGNFMVSDRKIKMIDLELAYDLVEETPKPAFTLGTPGYVAPEQRNSAVPTSKEDIYSLGALLLFLLTNKPAGQVIRENDAEMKDLLFAETGETKIIDVAILCLQINPLDRPSIPDIKIAIEEWLSQKPIKLRR